MGPLAGFRIIEIAGMGAAPFTAMMLADMGAEVLRVERPGGNPMTRMADVAADVFSRGRRCVAIDIRTPEGAAVVLDLVEHADALFEGNRPGVMERLGLGPQTCLARNPRLVYGRLTGWGQDGPLAHAAGHDINYIALSGVLSLVGRRGEPPLPPSNLLGDLAGGGMNLAFGLVCALLECQRSGRGQVVDAAMVDGAATLGTLQHGLLHAGYQRPRGENMVDSGAHFYNTYETADGEYIAIGSFEPRFYRELLDRLGLAEADFPEMDVARWPEFRERFAALFRTRTRAQWCEVFEGTDACFAPVLSLSEAPQHPHNVARGVFVDVAGVVQPRPSPRFSRTDGAIRCPPARPGQHTREALAEWGIARERIDELLGKGVLEQTSDAGAGVV
ncbi:MAG: Succinyl-CoA--L-malate CoA-transferase beta subunit [Pseudomonadales bacterium]|nr:Succinyl-CoA--L-malate CoA-transferase beta subunit [Pseudomonadales bacterium]